MKKKYLSNTFCMLGVALVATAIFRETWFMGTAAGIAFIFMGYKLDEEGQWLVIM